MMNRYKPVGWRHEPHRHSLAAQGVKTRYMAEKLSFSQFLDEAKYGKPEEVEPTAIDYDELVKQRQSAKTDGYYAEKDLDQPGFLGSNEKMSGIGMQLRQRDITVLQDSVVSRLDDAVARGELTAENRERFIKDDFRKEAEHYLNGRGSKEDFEDNVKRDMAHFMKVHNRKLPIGKIMEGKA